MKYIITAFFIASLSLSTTIAVSAKVSAGDHARSTEQTVTNSKNFLKESDKDIERDSPAEENDDPSAQARFEHLRLQDPATGKIPTFIREKELQYAAHIPTRNEEIASSSFKGSGAGTQATTWSLRGPYNIGGRTRALGIDINNQNVIVAGGISGGAWRSTNDGATWKRTTPVNDLPSVSCLVQDTRNGKTNTWYYGTGETIGNSEGYPLQDYTGDGIYKSTDDGVTWNVLPSTANSSVVFNQPFNYVYDLAIDPSNVRDVIYAATIEGVERSTDGGATWAVTLTGQGQSTYYTDVVVTTNGVVYAAINSNGSGNIFRSTDGVNWTDITPSGWTYNAGVMSIGLTPSNQNILYFFSNAYDNSTSSYVYDLWKYTYLSGNGGGSGGTWDDRSANVPGDFASYGGYCQYIKVMPGAGNENTVFLGGLELYRSTDGFATTSNTTTITNNMHVDQHSMAFFKADPTSMIVGNDGGIFLTGDNTAQSVDWTSLDNGYFTTQFYTVAIDHSTTGNNIVIGGMQDNSTFFTNSTDPTHAWSYLSGGDGTSCAISSGRSSYYVSYQNGVAYRELVDDNGNISTYGRVDPLSSVGYLWVNPMVLDPNNTDRMYFGGTVDVWRNDDMTQIPLGTNNQQTQGWNELTNTRSNAGSVSALAISTTPANRLYYGTGSGALFRLDDANTNSSTPSTITGSGFPSNGYINCIAVDSKNADNAIVVFSNYNVQSLFYTSDGGASWTPIGGNLEQYPDGSGNGPSCRWASIVHVSNSVVYLVGTSTGLYSTSFLNDTSTVWALEGASTIGNNIVAMMDARESDDLVAVASHGAGIYTGNIGTVQQVPTSPVLVFPTDGSVNIPAKTIFHWNSVTGETYTLQVSDNLSFSNIVYTHTLIQGLSGETADTATGLQGQTKYYWRVQGANSGGVGPFSPTWSFTTYMAVPIAPSLLSPATGTSNTPVKPLLKWSSSHGAATYHLEMSTSYSFGSPILDDSLITDTFYIPTGLAVSQRYYWRVSAANITGQSSYSPTWTFTTGATGVEENSSIPQIFTLSQNFPNPFTGTTSFNFSIAEEGMSSLKVYDVLGKEIATLVSRRLSPGLYSAQWDASAFPRGVYFYRLRSGTFSATKQMLLMK